jgi:hypothetical protein
MAIDMLHKQSKLATATIKLAKHKPLVCMRKELNAAS